MQLEPREYYVIGHELGDPSDSGTYFIQAVVRNARTDATIETVNLTDLGGGRFSKEWQVPADTSGAGFYISITKIVYEDSGYTIVSPIYGRAVERHLVQTRLITLGGGGASVDYRKVRELVREELKGLELPAPVVQTTVTQVDFAPLELYIHSLLESFRKSIPDPIPADLGPVLKQIAALPKPEKPEKIDLTPVLSAVANLRDEKTLRQLNEALSKVPELAAAMKNIEEAMKDFLYVLETQGRSSKSAVFKDFPMLAHDRS